MASWRGMKPGIGVMVVKTSFLRNMAAAQRSVDLRGGGVGPEERKEIANRIGLDRFTIYRSEAYEVRVVRWYGMVRNVQERKRGEVEE